MIKLKELLNEQKAEQFIIQPFKQTFLPNYITPNDNWKAEFTPILEKIKDKLAKGYTLDQLQITIESGASSDAATNGYQGTNPPNHNFQEVGVSTGGLLPGGKWTDVRSDRKNIGEPQGNNFLAKMRGAQLRNILLPYLKSQLGQNIPVEFIIVQPKLNSEKFVQVSLNSKVSKSPFVIKKGTYTLGQPTRTDGGTWGWRLLPKTGPTIGEPDLGAGPGVAIWVSKKLAGKLGLDSRYYIGDPQEYEQFMWNRRNKNNIKHDATDYLYINFADGSLKPIQKPMTLDQRPGAYGKQRKQSNKTSM